MDRDQLVELVCTSVASVRFVKRDGSIRDMLCTLRDEYITTSTFSSANAKENLDIVKVWDIEADDWRCFRVDSVISAKVAEV